MTGDQAKNIASTTIRTLETLLPVAATIIAIIGGVPVPVTQGIQVAQALLPVADEFILKIGTAEFTINTTGITTASQVREILATADAEGFPVLAFKSPGA